MSPLGLSLGLGYDALRRSGLALRWLAGDSLAARGATTSRTTVASYIDQNGLLQSAAINVTRDAHYIGGVRTWLLETGRTNSFLNSSAPATHTSPALAVGTYILWMVGSGSIAVAAGTATITGAGSATAAAPLVFSVTVTGTVTFTITGSVTRAQCENGSFATSFVTTAGVALARAADIDIFPFPYTPQPTTLYVKFIEQGTILLTSFQRLIQIGDTTAAARVLDIRVQSGKYTISHEISGGAAAAVSAAVAPSIGDTVEVRGVLNADGSVFIGQSINGGAEVVSATSSVLALAASWSAPSLALNQSVNGGSSGVNAFIAAKVALGNASMADLRAA